MSRALHLINFLCIIALLVLLVKQWNVSDQLHEDATKLTGELVSAEEEIDDLHTQAAALQNETGRLAAALTVANEQTKTTEQKHSALVDQFNNLIEQTIALQAQLEAAHVLINERDTRLKELADTLAVAQQRLDQAAARLKDEER